MERGGETERRREWIKWKWVCFWYFAARTKWNETTKTHIHTFVRCGFGFILKHPEVKRTQPEHFSFWLYAEKSLGTGSRGLMCSIGLVPWTTMVWTAEAWSLRRDVQHHFYNVKNATFRILPEWMNGVERSTRNGTKLTPLWCEAAFCDRKIENNEWYDRLCLLFCITTYTVQRTVHRQSRRPFFFGRKSLIQFRCKRIFYLFSFFFHSPLQFF